MASAGSIGLEKRMKLYSGTLLLSTVCSWPGQFEKNGHFSTYFRNLLQIWWINISFFCRNRVARKKVRRIRPIYSGLFQKMCKTMLKISQKSSFSVYLPIYGRRVDCKWMWNHLYSTQFDPSDRYIVVLQRTKSDWSTILAHIIQN